MADKWNKKRSCGFGNNEQDDPPHKRRRREEDLVYEYLNETDPTQFLMIEDKFGEYFCGLSSVVKSESNILPCIVHRGHHKRKSVLFHTQFKKNFVKNGVYQLLIQPKIETIKTIANVIAIAKKEKEKMSLFIMIVMLNRE